MAKKDQEPDTERTTLGIWVIFLVGAGLVATGGGALLVFPWLALCKWMPEFPEIIAELIRQFFAGKK